MRYVQIALFVSMFAIVIIWFLSFSTYGRKDSGGLQLDFSQNQKVEDLKAQKKSLDEATNGLKNAANDIDKTAPDKNSEGFQASPNPGQ